MLRKFLQQDSVKTVGVNHYLNRSDLKAWKYSSVIAFSND